MSPLALLLSSALAGDALPLPKACDAYLTDASKRPLHKLDEILRSGLHGWTLEDELALGEQLAEEIRTQGDYAGKVDGDRKQLRYLRKVLREVLEGVDEPRLRYTIHYVDDDTENAFAIPGGHVYVHRGLMERWVDNEAQLAVVIGHEVGHIELKHPSALLEYLAAFPRLDNDLGFLALALSRELFSSVQELDSDVFGMRAAYYSGYEASEGIALWEAKVDAPSTRPSGRQNRLFDLLGELQNIVASHPDPRGRACWNTRTFNALQAEHPMPEGFVGQRKYRRRQALGPRW